jgi:glycosyltransferase involved in cell wall biosynthesis
MEVAVAAERFGDLSDVGQLTRLPLMPWKNPAAAMGPAERASWHAVATAVRGSRSIADAKDRARSAPLMATQSDIVHFEFSGIAVYYLDRLEELARSHRLVVSCRGAAEQIEPLRDPSRAHALRDVFDVVDLIHCVSDDMRATVEQLGASSEKILVNRPAVPVGDFATLRRPPEDHGGPLRVLSVARLHWKKGFDDSMRAVAELRRRGVEVEYLIAGEGPEREKLSFLVHQLGLGSTVKLLGLQTQPQVRDLLTWADVFLLPSLSEGISNAALEAMAAGLPVVSTDCGGMVEVIRDGIDGFVVPVGDSAAMADRLALLDSDPDRRVSIASAAAATADDRLDLSHQAQRFLQAYRLLTLPDGAGPRP